MIYVGHFCLISMENFTLYTLVSGGSNPKQIHPKMIIIPFNFSPEKSDIFYCMV